MPPFMSASIKNRLASQKLLLDRGIDLDQYRTWAEKYPKNEGYEEAMEELTSYWEKQQTAPQQVGPSMGDMHL